LAEKCEFRVLKEELIMHKRIQGMKDVCLSESLQNDCLATTLTLAMVEHRARQSEKVKQQQAVVYKMADETMAEMVNKTSYKQTI
jgi:hypothetical protein